MTQPAPHTPARPLFRVRSLAAPSKRTAFLAAVALLALLPACDGSNGQAQQTPQEAHEAQAPQPEEQGTVDLAALGFDEGDMERSVIWVVEFSDFGCVYCAGFHQDTYPELYREFVEAGDVAWKYIPVTFAGFPNGVEAALTGKCAAAQDRFTTMRDLLYERREEWLASEEPVETFEGYAREVGLDEGEFVACFEGEEARERLAQANRIAVQIGVTGTPTFIVQGFPVQGAPALEDFREALRDMVARAREPGES